MEAAILKMIRNSGCTKIAVIVGVTILKKRPGYMKIAGNCQALRDEDRLLNCQYAQTGQ